jgi:hypothetical protein
MHLKRFLKCIGGSIGNEAFTAAAAFWDTTDISGIPY